MAAATPNPVVDLVVVTDWVWCETEGDIHTATEDPFHNGPQHRAPDLEEDPNWVSRENHDDWPGTLMYYVCPGPHFHVWTVLEDPIEALPLRGEPERLET